MGNCRNTSMLETMNWKAHKLLNEIYKLGKVKGNFLSHPELVRLIDMDFVQESRKGVLSKGAGFDEMYRQKFLEPFSRYHALLAGLELMDADTLDGEELETLLRIQAETAALLSREGLTLKQVSSEYFRSSKQVGKGSVLERALSKLLPGLIAESSHSQFLQVLHSENTAKVIVLCENMDQLNRPRRKNIELWYAGGNNTAKLKYVPSPSLPMYYLCDWDYVGMCIYSRIKTQYFPQIRLVDVPSPNFKKLDATGHHGWGGDLDWSHFTEGQRKLVEKLIQEGLWIEEESFGAELDRLVEDWVGEQ